MFFLRRLRSFNVCNRLLRMFYHSVVSSVLLFAVACWGCSICARDATRLNKLVKKASSVVGTGLDSLEVVADQRRGKKLVAMLANPSHPLYVELTGTRSKFSDRFVLPRQNTKRFGQSFIPAALRLYNQALQARGDLELELG